MASVRRRHPVCYGLVFLPSRVFTTKSHSLLFVAQICKKWGRGGGALLLLNVLNERKYVSVATPRLGFRGGEGGLAGVHVWQTSAEIEPTLLDSVSILGRKGKSLAGTRFLDVIVITRPILLHKASQQYLARRRSLVVF